MSHMGGYAASIEVSAGSAGLEWMMKAEAASCCEGARSPLMLTYMDCATAYDCKPLIRAEALRPPLPALQHGWTRYLADSPVRSNKAAWVLCRHAECSSSAQPGLYKVRCMPLLALH